MTTLQTLMYKNSSKLYFLFNFTSVAVRPLFNPFKPIPPRFAISLATLNVDGDSIALENYKKKYL